MNYQTRALRLVLTAALALLILAMNTKAQGTNVALQGTEAPSVSDGVDLFSGKLEQVLPLLQVSGRGGISQSLVLPLRNSPWRVLETNSFQSNDRVYRFYRAEQTNLIHNYARAGYSTMGRLEVETKYTGWFLSDTPAATELRFTTNQGQIIHFRDALTDGQPYEARTRGCIVSLFHPNPEAACSRGRTFRATDGSNAIFVADADVYDRVGEEMSGGPSPSQLQSDISGTIYLNNGTRIRIESTYNNVTRITDRNGNYVKFDYVTQAGYTLGFLSKITDSLNREVTIVYGDSLQPSYYDEIVYKGFGGAERRIRINYAKIENAMVSGQSLGVVLFPGVQTRCNIIATGAPCDPTPAGGVPGAYYATSILVPTSVVLPSGQQYQFYYNNYLEVARIKSPLGAYTDYTYGGVLDAGADGYSAPANGVGGGEIYRRISSLKNYDVAGQLVNETTFSNIPQWVPPSHPSSPVLDNVTVNTKDSAGTVLASVKHYFYDTPQAQSLYTFLPMTFGKEYKTEILNPVSQAVLHATERTWKQRTPFPWCGGIFALYVCDSVNYPDAGPPVDPRVTEVKTTLDSGQVAKRTFAYDQYNNPTDVSEFDYGQGTPGALLRRAHTTYVTASNYTSADVHLLNLPIQVSVFDPNDVEKSRTVLEYDNYSIDANHSSLVGRSGISGFDAAFTTSYGTRGNPTALTQFFLVNGAVTGSFSSYAQYDVAGNIVKAINANGAVTSIDFSDNFGAPNGNAVTTSAPTELASVGQSSYAFPSSVTNPMNHVTRMQLDYYTSRPVDTQDANGLVASAYSDNEPLDRITKTISAVNTSMQHQTTVAYNDVNRTVTSTSDRDTNTDGLLVTKQYFDSFGRTFETRQYESGSNYIVMKQEYDALGRVYRIANPYRPWQGETANWSQSTFDGLGHVTSVTTPDTAVASTAYNGSQTLTTDQDGKQRITKTNVLGQVTDVWEVTAADSATEAISFPGHGEVTAGYRTSYAYDVLDNAITVTQGSQSRTFSYDSARRLQYEITPERGTINYQYDSVGNLVVRTDARGVSTHFSYDAMDRPVRRWYNSSNSPSATGQNSPAVAASIDVTEEAKFFYDAQSLPAGAPTFTRGPSVGRLVAATYGTGSAGDYYGYGTGDTFVLKIQQIGGINYQTSAAYSVSGRMTSQVYPSGHTVSYAYDDAGRTNSFAGNLGDGNQRTYATGITYASLGGIKQEQFGTTTPVYNKLFYNIRGQLAEIREGTTPNNTDFEYGAIINFYDGCWGMCAGQPMPHNNGNLRRQEHWVKDAAGTVVAVNAQAFEYDSLNRVQRVYEGSSEQPTWKQQFLYDRFGNRRVDVANTTASLNPKAFELQTSGNRLLAPGDTNLAEASRQMRYDEAGNLTTDNYTGQGQRKYDGDNHMTQALAGGVWQVYKYDAGGRRVRRQVNGVETWQVYGLNGELLAEYSANGPATSPQKEYGYRNGQLLVSAGTGATSAAAPSALTAAPSSGGASVVLSWTAAAGATNYRVERKGASGSFVLAANTAATGLTDTGTSAGSAYLYRVCAANAQGNCTSVFSNIALGAAVSFPTDPTITSSADDPTGVNVTRVKAAHITELRTAVNAVRSLAGLSAAQWSNPNQTLTATVSIINAVDVQDLRTKLNEALTALGIQTSTYTDNTLAGAPTGTSIKKIHITQLRQRSTSGIGGAGGSSSTGYSVQWLVTDQLGTPRIVFDETGSLANVKRHDYLPFGEELTAGGRSTTPGYGVADGVRQQFTGYEHDGETGLDFAQARYYGNTQGRFTSPDPFNGSMSIYDPRSLNRYAYAQNNPLTFTDPSGMAVIEHGIDFEFWGDQAENLPGFGTTGRTSYAAFGEQKFQTAVAITIAEAKARDEAKANNDDNAPVYFTQFGIPFIGYFDENGVLTWLTGQAYELPNVNVTIGKEPKPNQEFCAAEEKVKTPPKIDPCVASPYVSFGLGGGLYLFSGSIALMVSNRGFYLQVGGGGGGGLNPPKSMKVPKLGRLLGLSPTIRASKSGITDGWGSTFDATYFARNYDEKGNATGDEFGFVGIPSVSQQTTYTTRIWNHNNCK